MAFTRIPLTTVLVALAAAPTISHAAKLIDASECSIRGALTGKFASASALGGVDAATSELQGFAASQGGRATQRVNYAIEQARLMREQGETDPVMYAARAAALCMLDK
ncbi:hypothetical protein [Burkholderia pseudomallei]|uniref:hypothetical protein n=1 Tax=Burkholderia pseudomallei TaxID=28450 RepID=UPI000F04763B|nr:hypothetical protein [Burkholderia pseudomallei]